MPEKTPASKADIERLERILQVLTEDVRKQLDITFKRIAQMQADLDLIRAAWAKNNAPNS
jgi:hypothetical protein